MDETDGMEAGSGRLLARLAALTADVERLEAVAGRLEEVLMQVLRTDAGDRPKFERVSCDCGVASDIEALRVRVLEATAVFVDIKTRVAL